MTDMVLRLSVRCSEGGDQGIRTPGQAVADGGPYLGARQADVPKLAVAARLEVGDGSLAQSPIDVGAPQAIDGSGRGEQRRCTRVLAPVVGLESVLTIISCSSCFGSPSNRAKDLASRWGEGKCSKRLL